MGEFNEMMPGIMRSYIKNMKKGNNNMKKEIYTPIIGIIIAELLLFSGGIFYGLGLHIINILFIIFIIIFLLNEKQEKEKNVLQSLMLVILLRLTNLSVPQFFANPLLQYPLIYGVMIIPIYYIIKNQQMSSKELGIDFRMDKIKIYLPIAVLIGIVIAIIEYKILNPVSLIEDIDISNIIIMIIVMFVFVASIEEIIFRSILQTRVENMSGPKNGIILNGVLFGIMHASYGIIGEILFASVFGIILGYIFYKTKNLPFVVTIHGIVNVILFGIISKILI